MVKMDRKRKKKTKILNKFTRDHEKEMQRNRSQEIISMSCLYLQHKHL